MVAGGKSRGQQRCQRRLNDLSFLKGSTNIWGGGRKQGDRNQMKTVNTAFRRGIVHFCQSCHRMANSDKPQNGKFILYSSPLEFAALLRVIAFGP